MTTPSKIKRERSPSTDNEIDDENPAQSPTTSQTEDHPTKKSKATTSTPRKSKPTTPSKIKHKHEGSSPNKTQTPIKGSGSNETWTPEKRLALFEAYQAVAPVKWDAVAEKMGGGVSAKACRDQWHRGTGAKIRKALSEK